MILPGLARLAKRAKLPDKADARTPQPDDARSVKADVRWIDVTLERERRATKGDTER